MTQMSVFRDLELHIICITKKDKDSARKLLEKASKILQPKGFEPTCEILEGNPEPSKEKYILEKDIDFLLMGAYGHSRIRRLVIGSTTTQMLRSSHILVILFR